MITEIIRAFADKANELENLIESLADSDLLFQPAEGVNHIAWNVGHLVYSFQAIGDEMGIPHWLSSEWNDMFGEGSHLHANMDLYPNKAGLLESVRDGKQRILERLKRMSPEEMEGQLPDERFRHIFPTLGHAVLNTLVSHFAFHYGQICALRKIALVSNTGVDRTNAGHA